MRPDIGKIMLDALMTFADSGFDGVSVFSKSSKEAVQTIIYPAVEKLDAKTQASICRIIIRHKLADITKLHKDQYRVTITPAGIYRLNSLRISSLEIPALKEWDNRWRLICYDLPSTKNKERYTLTRQLERLGFLMIQKSLWVHPMPCLDVLEQLADLIGVRRYISVFEVSNLDANTKRQLENHFSKFL